MIRELVREINFSSQDEKIVLFDTFYHPGILARNIALHTGKICNTKFLTFRDFVFDKSITLIKNKKPLSGDLLFWRLFGLLQKEKNNLPYFAEVSEFPGFVRLYLSTLESMQLNRCSPSTIPKHIKWNDISHIYGLYCKIKEEEGYYDYADALDLLIRQKSVSSNPYCLKFRTSALEQELIDKWGIRLIELPKDANHEYTIEAYKVDTQHQEVMQTIRLLQDNLQNAKTPVKIGIMVDDYPVYSSLFSNVLNSIDLTGMLHYVKGTPFFQTSVGKHFAYYLEWAENSFSIYRWIKILNSGRFNKNIFGGAGNAESDNASDFYKCIKIIKDTEIPLFSSSLKITVKNRVIDEDSENESGNAVKLALSVIEAFENIASARSPKDQYTALLDTFVATTRTSSELDAQAIKMIVFFRDEWVSNPFIKEQSLTDCLQIISDHFINQNVGRILPDFRKPVIGTLSDLLPFEFDILFILGLNENSYPKKVYENPLFLDEEHDVLKAASPKARFYSVREIKDEEKNQLSGMLANVKNRVVYSAPLRDLESGREYLVSSFLLEQLNRDRADNERYDYKSASEFLGNSKYAQHNYIPESADLALYDYEAANSLFVYDKDSNSESISGQFIFTEKIKEYRNNRKKADGFNEYWGYLSLDPNRELGTFSCSRFSTWVNCPQSFFLKYEMKLDRTEDFDATRLEWLDSLQFGDFIHTLFYRFFIEIRESRNVDSFNAITDDDKPLLDDLFDRILKEYEIKYPVVSQIHFEKRRQELAYIKDRFFENEKNNTDTRLFVELSFNMPASTSREPLSKLDEPAVVSLSDGSEIKVRGSIDRVDKSVDRYILYDYKTGKSFSYDDKRPFNGGKHIQAGLYPLIVTQIKKEIIKPVFKYYYTSEKGRFAKTEYSYDLLSVHFRDLITKIVTQIKKGNFVPLKGDMRFKCENCDFQNECIKYNKDRAKRLSDNHPGVEIYNEIIKEII